MADGREDRRQSKRIHIAIPFHLATEDGFKLIASRDVSAGGAFFDRSIPYPVGQTLSVSFTLPGEATPIRCRGEVVNVPDFREFGMGVRFIELAPADLDKLQRFSNAHDEKGQSKG